ncbi:MuF-like minor capsid protein [Microbacterium phage Dewdrop]|nr:MuF-like minor capsid protein [Microbacterium phage Leaf]QGZ17424.1 MuF-like minor capsid protein [Microbacterium phage Dewdrop]
MDALAELNVSSPATAIARQAAIEANLRGEAEQMMRRFLGSVLAKATSGVLYPPDVTSRWTTAVEDMLDALPSETAEYVRESFLEEEIPNDVYTTAETILVTAAQTYASVAERNDALARALSPDGFEVEQLGLTAAGFWDSLQETGNVWIKRIRRTVRTSATGMVSRFTVTAIRLQDYPMKRWVTRHDDHVRYTHRQADGQTVPVDQPFIVGGARLMYPGEREALYGEIVNCRCVLIGVR